MAANGMLRAWASATRSASGATRANLFVSGPVSAACRRVEVRSAAMIIGALNRLHSIERRLRLQKIAVTTLKVAVASETRQRILRGPELGVGAEKCQKIRHLLP